jgi:hypothetical protein
MAKLQDLFTQARRTRGSGGMGFLGKSRGESKAHAAALVVAFPQVVAGGAEAALKSGADGLLFSWDGKNESVIDTIKKEIEASKAANDEIITGLHINDGLKDLTRDRLASFKEVGINYIIIPFNAPTRLLAIEAKEVEKVVTVPVRQGDMYPLVIRNLSGFENISAVVLDFELTSAIGDLTIEESLQYRAVREGLRFPAFVKINNDITEAEAYTLIALGVQGFILGANENEQALKKEIKRVREILETIHKEEKDTSSTLLRP